MNRIAAVAGCTLTFGILGAVACSGSDTALSNITVQGNVVSNAPSQTVAGAGLVSALAGTDGGTYSGLTLEIFDGQGLKCSDMVGNPSILVDLYGSAGAPLGTGGSTIPTGPYHLMSTVAVDDVVPFATGTLPQLSVGNAVLDATSGTVVITTSTQSLLEGSFNLTFTATPDAGTCIASSTFSVPVCP
jgi:hypothetical protein